MSGRLMIYGATGYTGKLMAEEAAKKKLNPILAGRDQAKLDALAKQIGGAEIRCFSLDDAAAVKKGLEGVACVLHAAGPFTITAKPMLDACIAAKAHYLDITGEFSVFELAESMSDKAQAAGVMLMPGVGWDVIPSDCVALHTSKRVKQPKSLRIFLKHYGAMSRGSMKTGAYIAATGPKSRKDGQVVNTPQKPTTCDFGKGLEDCPPFPMGDVITAWHSTHIPNIEVFFSVGAVGSALEAGAPPNVDEMPEGPTAEQRAAGRSRVVAEVTDADGKVVRSMIESTSGYSYTGEAGIEVARRVLAGDFKPGFQGPASVYGEELATSVGEGKFIDL